MPEVDVITINKKERQKMALSLRRKGISYAEIGRQLGPIVGLPKYGRMSARRDVMEALDELKLDIKNQAESVLHLELSRLDEMHSAFWPKAIGTAMSEEDMNRHNTQMRVLSVAMAKGLSAMQEDNSLSPNDIKALSDSVRTTIAELNRLREFGQPDIAAAKMVLDIMERRAKLLGLDKINVNVRHDVDVSMLNITTQVAGMTPEDLQLLIQNLDDGGSGVAPTIIEGNVSDEEETEGAPAEVFYEEDEE